MGLERASASTLATLATIGALMTAAPIVVLFWLAGSPQGGWETLTHLALTVLPSALVNSLLLALIVLAVVLLVGVGCGWLVAAYDFPGRGWLAWALVLPLSMPAFVMAYAYTDFLDTSGPLQSWLRASTGWAVREYWFPDVRSLPGAGLFLGLALYPYVYMLARSAFVERSPSFGEAARSLGLGARAAWWRVIWPVARPAVAAGCALVLMETLADFGTVTYFGVDTLTAGIYRSWQGLGDKIAAARLSIVLLLFVGLLVFVERRQRARMRFYARSMKPAPRIRLSGWRGCAGQRARRHAGDPRLSPAGAAAHPRLGVRVDSDRRPHGRLGRELPAGGGTGRGADSAGGPGHRVRGTPGRQPPGGGGGDPGLRRLRAARES